MLTEKMKETLFQIGCGVFVRGDHYESDDGRRVDLRSANALMKKGLITYAVSSSMGMLCGVINLSTAGEKEFEKMREERL